MNIQELLGEKYRENMTVQELVAALEAVELPDPGESETVRTLQEQVKSLTRENNVNRYTNRYLAMGYQPEAAAASAEALADGKVSELLNQQQTFLEQMKASLKAEQMRNTPGPAPGADGGDVVDYTKQIQAAQQRGDLAQAVYLTRLAEQQKDE